MAIKQLNDLSVDGDLTVSGGGTFQTPVTIDSDGSADNYYLNFSESGSSRFTIYENSNNIYFNGWAGHTIFRPQMAGSGSFAVIQGNTQFDTSGNATFAGNLTVTGGTITLGGTSFTKESVFITRTPTVGTTSDWDDFIQQGTYGVASSGGAQFTGDNRPVATKNSVTFEPDYRYGHLVVTEDSSGQGIQQTYYPHSGNQKVFTRTGWSDSSWGNWTMNWNTANMGSGSYLDADTLDGNHASAFVLAADIDVKQVAYGDGTGLNGDDHFIWDDTNNRLGIGTTTPLADIHIEDAGNSSSGLRFSAVGTGNQDNVNFHFQGQAGSAPFYISRANTGGAEIQLQRDGDVILNGTNGDNCGIGTASPSQKLDVNGNVRFRSLLYASNNSAGSSGQVLSSTGSGTQWISVTSDTGVPAILSNGSSPSLNSGITGAEVRSLIGAGTGNGNGTISGSGTASYVPRFTNSTTLGNGIIRDNGTNVGIGTSPDSNNKLVVNGSLRVVDNIYLNTGTSNSIVGTGGGIEFYTNSTKQVDIDGNGDLQVLNNLQFSTGGNNLITGSSGDMVFKTNNSQRMEITSGGAVQLSVSGANIGFDVDGTSRFYQGSTVLTDQAIIVRHDGAETSSTFATMIQFQEDSGTVRGSIKTSGTSTQYNTTSDYRLKKNFKDFNGLDLVSQIPVYDFNWKVGVDPEEGQAWGVKAHELQEIIPNAVSGEKDGEEMQGVDYSKLVPVLVKAIQELEAKVKILENK